jgi:poly(3-hydroxybutyrate) depolymerase
MIAEQRNESKESTMSPSWCRVLLMPLGAAGLLTFVTALSPAAAQTVSLPSYDVDINQISVSGLSSGGYMAVQFDVAFSSLSRGAGVIAGGPYYCAQGNSTTAEGTCSCFLPCLGQSSTNVAQLITVTDQNAGAGLIDPTSNLSQHRIWLFSGTKDTIVPQRIMDDLSTYYRRYVGAADIAYKNDVAAEHAMPTDFFGNSCDTLNDPYISNCSYDAAGQLLQWIYGPLHPKNSGGLTGSFVNFDQSEFIDGPTGHGMAADGWLYVPSTCNNRQACGLHVVFHGCKQYETYLYFSLGTGFVTFGTTYVRNTGYNKWADNNNIIVLYPQATASTPNPFGCWDWWGYDDANYAVKTGRQMAAVKRMIDRIASANSALPR